jgi:hypothetical protein
MATKGTALETKWVTLEEFLVLPWIPLAPGQYYTDYGRSARDRAEMHILTRTEDDVVYDPDGKGEMIKGGLGCIRLLPKTVGGQELTFLSATSTGKAFGGVLVGVSDDLWRKLLADPIHKHGGVVCTLVGQLCHWTNAQDLPFDIGQGLPRLFLNVEKVEIRGGLQRPNVSQATATITFEGTVDNWRDVFYTFRTFDPSQPGSLHACVKWLETNYVAERYCGRVITDFDETARWFARPRLPMTTLMDPTVDAETLTDHATDALELKEEWARQETARVVNVNVYGPVSGAVIGDNTQVTQHFEPNAGSDK